MNTLSTHHNFHLLSRSLVARKLDSQPFPRQLAPMGCALCDAVVRGLESWPVLKGYSGSEPLWSSRQIALPCLAGVSSTAQGWNKNILYSSSVWWTLSTSESSPSSFPPLVSGLHNTLHCHALRHVWFDQILLDQNAACISCLSYSIWSGIMLPFLYFRFLHCICFRYHSSQEICILADFFS